MLTFLEKRFIFDKTFVKSLKVDPYAELLESAIGHPCQYDANSTYNLENNNIIQPETLLSYN